jgi:hypothetical protein
VLLFRGFFLSDIATPGYVKTYTGQSVLHQDHVQLKPPKLPALRNEKVDFGEMQQ